MKITKFLLLTTAVAVALATAGAAIAAPNYFARAGTSSNTFVAGDQKESSEGVTVDIVSPLIQDFFILFHSGEGHAAAGPFGLRAGARGTMDLATTKEHGFVPASFVHGGSGFAVMTLNDIVISGPGSGTVPGSLNLSANGNWDTSALVSGPFIGAASAGVRVKLEIQTCTPLACPGFQGEIKAGRSMSADGHVDQSLERTGLFDAFSGSGLITTDMVDLPLDTPVFLQMKLDVNGGSDFQVGGTSCCDPIRIDTNGVADFTHTVTFPTSRPVFNLPPGYTVNAPSVGIVNNHWTLGGPAPDTTPPAIACDSPDGAWHATDVSLSCTASDDGSGLANPDDASFSLATAVADGSETADAPTGSRDVCDQAGNCVTAGPIGGNRVDKKAPAITINAPGDAASYLLGQVVAADYGCGDGGSGVASCTGPVPTGSDIDTASVGAKTFVVEARDAVGNTSQRSVAYQVGYRICALYDETKASKLGSTIPIKLQLCDASGRDVSSPAVLVHALGLTQVSDNATEAVEDSGNANPDADFRYDAALGGTGGYIYNLSTKGLSVGSWIVTFTASGDPTPHTLLFQLR
jgi:hypothetical protein